MLPPPIANHCTTSLRGQQHQVAQSFGRNFKLNHKDLLSEGIHLRRAAGGAQLADALTKAMEASFLRETLAVGVVLGRLEWLESW